MPAPPLPGEHDWDRLAPALEPGERRRIKGLARRGRSAGREDEAFLVIAFAKHELARLWLLPLWFIPTLLAIGFLPRLIVYRDLDRVLEDTLSIIFLPLLLGILSPLVWAFRLQQAVIANSEFLARLHAEEPPTPFPTPGTVPPPSSRR